LSPPVIINDYRLKEVVKRSYLSLSESSNLKEEELSDRKKVRSLVVAIANELKAETEVSDIKRKIAEAKQVLESVGAKYKDLGVLSKLKKLIERREAELVAMEV